MGESHPGQATASACQLLTEQPGKDLQTMGNEAVDDRPSNLGCAPPPLALVPLCRW